MPGIVVLSYLIANSRTPILDMMSYSWGIISGSFLAPYLIALYWKGINRAGAWAGMLSGFAVACPPVVCKLLFPAAQLPYFGKIVDLGPHFACAAMAVSLLACVVVSRDCPGGRLEISGGEPRFYASAPEAAAQT